MMRTKTALSIILLTFFTKGIILAQELSEFDPVLSVTYVNPNGVSSANYIYDMVRSDGETYVIYKHEKKAEFLVHRLEEETTTEETGKFEFKDPRTKFGLAGVGTKTFTPFFSTDHDKKSNCLYAQELSLSKGVAIDAPYLVGCLRGEDYYRNFANSFASFQTSPDSSKLMIYFKMPELEDGTKVFRFMVFDEEFRQLWEKDVPITEKGKELRIGGTSWFMAEGNRGPIIIADQVNREAIKLSNNGSVYFWAVHDRGRSSDGPQRFENYLVEVTENSVETEMVGSPDYKLWFKNLKLETIGDGVVISGRIKSWGEPSKWTQGGYYAATWINGDFNSAAIPYDPATLTLNMNAKEKEKAQKTFDASKTISWGKWENERIDVLLKKDFGSGFFLINDLPKGKLIISFNSSCEQEWTRGFAISRSLFGPDIFQTKRSLIFNYWDHPAHLEKGWTVEKDGLKEPKGKRVEGIAVLSLSDSKVFRKRATRKNETGGEGINNESMVRISANTYIATPGMYSGGLSTTADRTIRKKIAIIELME
ncbi:MAG: hypothetical protein JKX84_01500 [Flavobacteriales bacterium]|nr:hypothetical protein [Flavobacteriales bacterium]